MTYLFTSKRLGFREWLEEDLLPFSLLNADPTVMEYFPRTYSKTESAKFIEKIKKLFATKCYGLYAVDELATNTFIGFIGFWHPSFEADFTPMIEIGWRLRAASWNKGFATEGAIACLQYGFEKLNFTEVYSLTAKINQKSERIMQKIGMTKVQEFEHPKLENTSPLKTHVLYKIEKPKQ